MQNCRIWGTENPCAYIEKPTHPKRATVWCGFWSKGIIGPFFFENERPLQSEEEYIGNIWFQKNDATCHTAEATFDVLRSVFEDRIISRRADVIWPPRSCDFTPLDYYLWGGVKVKCYTDKPETTDALKDNIREAISEIQLHTSIMYLKIGSIV